MHKYAQNGKRIASWSEPGAGPGQFSLPHNISCDADGWVCVADRENHRIQVFDGDVRFETQWHNLHRPSEWVLPKGKCPICGHCAESGFFIRPQLQAPAPHSDPLTHHHVSGGRMRAIDCLCQNTFMAMGERLPDLEARHDFHVSTGSGAVALGGLAFASQPHA